MGNGMSRVGCRNLLAGVVQKSMCFSIFFCGCKLLKSLHISFFGGKDSANRMQNKMNSFIFYAEVQLIFVLVQR